MFEGIKVVTTPEYVWGGFIQKGCTNIIKSKLTVISLLKWKCYFLKTASQMTITLCNDIKDFIQIITSLFEVFKSS